MTDWDAELKKIDKQLESISDSAMIPAPAKGAPPAAKKAVAVERETTRTWPAFVRLALATALAAGILFWPYSSRCGMGLAGYMDPNIPAPELAGVKPLTQWYNQALEQVIRKDMHQYWWVHRKWREEPKKKKEAADDLGPPMD